MPRILRILPSALIALTAPAAAAERNYAIGSFDRLRVDGPFRVIVTLGGSPGARATGDPRVTDTLDIRVEGSTLVIRAGANGWGEQPMAKSSAAPVIRLSTQGLRGAALIGGGDVTISGPFRGQRVDLSLAGSGTMRVSGLDADQFSATLVGSGSMILAGRAARGRLTINGTAQMNAGALAIGDLALDAEGNGEVFAQARHTASVSSIGLGAVTIYGQAACTVRRIPAGPFTCGVLPPP